MEKGEISDSLFSIFYCFW